ncbi:TetR/AcrR family transcriptional regulator [Amycolatopsis thermophila]|uniref:AcrR family transcriptional regulator n=1 Tax=Amycolatopsis thermophila TaxID=206084 RepID=A0ABU0EYW4_9PSEU|nr:TetR/AcrR family transcriptional regulator [Amycolatopsis thermophila]MDQ0380304.1 AcrR family transcriptional regulator [Amycolatopsis thermophila]
MGTRSAGRRADLLAASARLFRERGFGGVSVADVADQVGITASAVYKHFPGKKVLLSEPIREMVLTWRDREMLALAEGGDPETVLRRLTTTVVAVVLERPDVVGLWHQEAHHLPAEVRDELIAVRVEGVGLWSRVLREVRPELDAGQSEFRIRAALGLLNCVPVLPRRRLRAQAPTLETLVLATLLAPPPPPELLELGAVERAHEAATGRRAEILAGAARLFRTRGYHAVGIDDIGHAIGIAGPSLYSHYPSKAALLTALIEETADELCWCGARALATGDDPAKVLELLVSAHVRTALADRDRISVWMTEAHHIPRELGRQVRQDRQRYLDYWVRAVRALRPELSEQVAQTASRSVMELIHAVARSSRFAGAPRLAEWTAGLALAALTAPELAG